MERFAVIDPAAEHVVHRGPENGWHTTTRRNSPDGRIDENRAVDGLLVRRRETPELVVQRTVVTIAGGGTVGSDAGTANHKSDVLAVLDRLHVLWAIDNDGYNTARAAVGAGADLVAAEVIRTLGAALDWGSRVLSHLR